MSEPTPRPWNHIDNGEYQDIDAAMGGSYGPEGGPNLRICTFQTSLDVVNDNEYEWDREAVKRDIRGIQKANAKHIVKCVNAYEELVGALREINDIYNMYTDDFPLDAKNMSMIATEALRKLGEL